MSVLSRLLCLFLLALALVAAPLASGPQAGPNDPLFINLTSDDGHRIDMALTFGGNQLKRGHPLTVFLNDRAVLAGSKANAGTFQAQQKAIADLLAAGAAVLICPMCMKHYGVTEADLIPGLVVGDPQKTGEALFRDNGKTLTW